MSLHRSQRPVLSELSASLICLLSLSACLSPQPTEQPQRPELTLATAQSEVIYGEDTRVDVYQAPDELAQRARRSIMAMIPSDRIDESDPSNIELRAATVGQNYRLCDDQRFRDQLAAASCSATLIEDDLIVTAGHCITSQEDCLGQRFVLGYLMEANGLAPLSSSDVFSCQQLILTYNDNEVDYAFVRLDRPVPNERGEPAPVSLSTLPLSQGEPLVMMGFPSGLPLKIEDGGFVSDPRPMANDFFRATVDAFGGNSGSGVFNEAGEQVGILVRGEQDYVSRGRCTVVNELSLDRGPGDAAEEITYLHLALSVLCATGFSSERLCGAQPTGGLCSSCGPGQPCQDGLNCAGFSSLMTELTFCAPSCELGAPCPNGHICVNGQCELNATRVCDAEGDVGAVDSCGRVLGIIEECGEASYCRRGACLLRGEGDTCESATQLEAVTQTVRGTLSEGYEDSRSGSCAGAGPERFYTFTLEAPNHLRAIADGFDTVLYLQRGAPCEPELELACNDDGSPNTDLGSVLDLDLEAGTYTLVLDSFTQDFIGDFTLELSFCDESCSPGEVRCDADGLVSVCEQSPAASCLAWSRPFDCPQGLVCLNQGCEPALQGDRCDDPYRLSAPFPESVEGELSSSNTIQHRPRCADDLSGDLNYELQIPYDARVIASYVSGPVSALSLRAGCGDEGLELSCAPQVIGAGPLDATVAPGSYTLTVSGLDEGPYRVDLRVEPLCVSECTEGALRCSPDAPELQRCQLGPDGCSQWGLEQRCEGAGGCLGGACVDDCFHECDEATSECISLTQARACVEDELGCRIWRELPLCEEGERCAEDGVCRPLDQDWGMGGTEAGTEAGSQAGVELAGVEAGAPIAGDSSPPANLWVGELSRPRELEITARERGGCEQGASAGQLPATLLGLFACLGALSRRRERLSPSAEASS